MAWWQLKVPGDRPGELAVLQLPTAVGLLMLSQPRFAGKWHTARLGGLPSIVGSLHDPLALVLGQRA
jgi:hypothetical protein